MNEYLLFAAGIMLGATATYIFLSWYIIDPLVEDIKVAQKRWKESIDLGRKLLEKRLEQPVKSPIQIRKV